MEATRPFDIIVGIHGIYHALKNREVSACKLFATKEGQKELRKRDNSLLSNLEIIDVSTHGLQGKAQKYYKELNLKYSRIPSNAFLLAPPLKIQGVAWLYNIIETNSAARLICLDGVTDIHNAAAILRTSAFYGVDALIISGKGSFGITPSLFRMASGATEYVQIVTCSNLSKVIQKIKDKGVLCVGLSEYADQTFSGKLYDNESQCLLLGAEDRGLSHSVSRVVTDLIKLESHGEIQSLNVSVAAALAMQKLFTSKV